jgi:hypothetical protein
MENSKGRRPIQGAVIAACAALVAGAALAGSRYSQPSVSITNNSDGSGYAMGTLGGVRNSANTRERLACTVTRTEITSAGVPRRSTVVSCVARDANGVSASCVSTLEKHAVALNGVSNDSLIEFHYDAAGTCTTLWVYESGSLERKRS